MHGRVRGEAYGRRADVWACLLRSLAIDAAARPTAAALLEDAYVGLTG